MSKAHVMAIDYALALVLSTLVFSSFFFTWGEVSSRFSDINSRDFQANRAMDFLLETNGSPTSWNSTTISQADWVGIARERNVVDENKLKQFIKSDYNKTREKLGIKPYNYFFNFTYADGSPYLYDGENASFSGILPANDSDVTVVRGIGLLNGSRVMLKLMVWGLHG